MAGGAAEVHQGEVELACVLMHAGAPPDDLLELGHGANGAVEHDEPAGLHIDAGRKQPRGSDQYRVSGFGVDEVVQLCLAITVAAGDAHDVTVVRLHQIGVFVNECLTHAGGVLLVNAENDRFLELVPAFLQKLRDFPGDEFGSVIQNQRAVEVFGVVDSVLDFDAVSIELSMLGTVAFHVTIDMDLDDLVGGKKAVADALFQGVRIDRLAEVIDVGNVLGFPGRGGQADLGGR